MGLAVNPKSIALDASKSLDSRDVADGVATMQIDSSGMPCKSVEGHLIQQFYAAKLSDPMLASTLPLPKLIHDAVAPKLALQPPREVEAERMDTDEYYLMDDPKVHGKSKMKKAFCEPGNVSFCPPISLASAFTFDIGGGTDDGKKKEILIKRTEE